MCSEDLRSRLHEIHTGYRLPARHELITPASLDSKKFMTPVSLDSKIHDSSFTRFKNSKHTWERFREAGVINLCLIIQDGILIRETSITYRLGKLSIIDWQLRNNPEYRFPIDYRNQSIIQAVSVELNRTDFCNRTIKLCRTKSNDSCLITELNRTPIELYENFLSSMKFDRCLISLI